MFLDIELVVLLLLSPQIVGDSLNVQLMARCEEKHLRGLAGSDYTYQRLKSKFRITSPM